MECSVVLRYQARYVIEAFGVPSGAFPRCGVSALGNEGNVRDLPLLKRASVLRTFRVLADWARNCQALVCVSEMHHTAILAPLGCCRRHSMR